MHACMCWGRTCDDVPELIIKRSTQCTPEGPGLGDFSLPTGVRAGATHMAHLLGARALGHT